MLALRSFTQDYSRSFSCRSSTSSDQKLRDQNILFLRCFGLCQSGDDAMRYSIGTGYLRYQIGSAFDCSAQNMPLVLALIVFTKGISADQFSKVRLIWVVIWPMSLSEPSVSSFLICILLLRSSSIFLLLSSIFNIMYSYLKSVWSRLRINPALPLVSLLWTAPTFCTPLPKKSEVIRGQYENKIRRYSPFEKVFETFATHYQKGTLHMDKLDLLKSICFYNYCEKQGTVPDDFDPKNLCSFVDIYDDGTISIYEYYTLMVFLSHEESALRDMFKPKQTLKIEDYYAILKATQQSKPCQLRSTGFLESRRVKVKVEDIEKTVHACAEKLHRLYPKIKIEDLLRMRRRIFHQIFAYEFYMMPRDASNTIDAVDFAKSIAKYIEPSKISRYISKACTIKSPARISLQQYIGFHIFLQTKMETVKKLCQKRGAIAASEIHESILEDMKLIKAKFPIKQEQSDIFLRMLDEDDSGFIEKKQLQNLLTCVKYYSTSVATPDSPIEKMKKDWEKWQEKFKRIREIVYE